jgi:predicted DCC family thiol-disulfide oxidoreductase YuxK
MQNENKILLFDGVCNLCNGTVNFILKRDKSKQIQFVLLQSEVGKVLVSRLRLPEELDSIIFLSGDNVFIESEAAFEIAKLLPTPWNWFLIFKIIPVKLGNGIYRWIAKNRYHWFGKREKCRIV